jgi:hypothetical protein
MGNFLADVIPGTIEQGRVEMKLGEALLLRSDIQKRLSSLKSRLVSNSLIQEGEEPHENPEKLFRQLKGLLRRFEQLIGQINRANLANRLSDGTPLTDALAHRDALILEHATLHAFLKAASSKEPRYSQSEIKYLPTVDVTAHYKRQEKVAHEIRELNTRLQEANWRVEIEL